MPCDRIRTQLTAYLDGELEGDRGTVVRGHLRTCEACRDVAANEAALRDGLRALPSVDPPSTMWAGVQARLAAAEVAESERPAWRRVLTGWLHRMPTWRTAAATSVVAAMAITVLYLRTQRDQGEPESGLVVTPNPPPVFQPQGLKPPLPPAPSADDVTADLLAEPTRITAGYKESIAELLAVANQVRPSWSADRQAAFDAKVKALSAAIQTAEAGKPQHRACSTLIRYLENAASRDEVALAGALP
jgi:hypothetical protein